MPTYQVTDPDSGVTLKLTGDSPPTEEELTALFSQHQPQQAPQRTPEQTEQLRQQRLEEVPEFGTGSGLLAGESGLKRAQIAAALPVTTDPQEMAQILEAQFPGKIGIAYTPEGRIIARNNETGAVAELNKPNLSLIDAAQFLGVASAFTPTGAGLSGVGAKTLGTLAARSAATQAGIEAGQAAVGGEFSPKQVAIEGAVAPLAQVGVEKAIKPVLSAGARSVAAKFGTKAELAEQAAQSLIGKFRSADEVTPESVGPFLKGKVESVAEFADVDPQILRAIEEEGIKQTPITSQVSRSSQFRDIEQALATVPGSSLDRQSREFIKAVSRRADDLILESGGSIDKAAVSDNFSQAMTDTISELGDQADVVYKSLDDLIDPTTRVRADSTVSFIQEKARELGGVDKLSPRMKKLLNDLSPKTGSKQRSFSVVTGANVTPGEVKLPTHELLSQRRREIGQALNKKSGNFKDEEQGLLKALYARLSQDQDVVAEAIGGHVSNIARTAKDLIIQRKQLEENAVALLGRDLSKSITEVVGASIKGLPKKGIAQFQKRINAIPEGNRQEIVATALNDIFRGAGAGKQAFDATQFSKFMDDLNRSPTAKKALLSQLPTRSRRSLENLNKIAKGISEAQLQKTPTGRILSLFDQKTGLVKKLVGRVAGGAAYMAGGGGLSGGAASDAVSELLTQKTGKAVAASDLLASQKFQNMVKTAVREGSIEGGQVSRNLQTAEAALRKSEAFQQWANTIEDSALSDALKNGTIGISAYLFSEV